MTCEVAHCRREYDAIGVGCSPSLTPHMAMGVYLVLNAMVGALLAATAAKIRASRVP